MEMETIMAKMYLSAKVDTHVAQAPQRQSFQLKHSPEFPYTTVDMTFVKLLFWA